MSTHYDIGLTWDNGYNFCSYRKGDTGVDGVTNADVTQEVAEFPISLFISP